MVVDVSLRLRGPKSTVSIKVSQTLTLKNLKDVVRETLRLETDTFDLLWGYPLKKADFDLETSIEGRITNNETIIVQLVSGPTIAINTSSELRSKKRKAESVVQQRSPALKFGARIATLSVSSDTRRKSSVKSLSIDSQGKRRKRTQMKASNEEDISAHLLEAVSGGTGKKNNFLRAVFRRAVELQYDASKAQARVTAALLGSYKVVESASARILGTGASTQLKVQYHKGPGSRSVYEETVDLLDLSQLRGVVLLIVASDEVDAREALRPVAMAGCSPRVFWSLVRLFGGDVENGLRLLLPDHDWSWLKSRKRTLSEKAMENLRQQQHTDAAAITDVELEASVAPSKSSTSSTVTDFGKEFCALAVASVGESADLDDFVPSEALPALRRVLGGNDAEPAVKRLADMGLERLLASLPSHAQISEHMATDIIDEARRICLTVLWKRICLCLASNRTDERTVFQHLKKLGVQNPSSLSVWRHSLETLFREESENGVSLASIGVSITDLRDVCFACHSLLLVSAWMAEVNAEQQEDESEEQERARLAGEGWLVFGADTDEKDGSARLGRSVLVLWEEELAEGTVMAYLPPTEDEPMALWKVRPSTESGLESGMRQDLEEHELAEALKLFQEKSRSSEVLAV